MDHHAGLARTGTGQHQLIGLHRAADNPDLNRVVEAFDDLAVRFHAGGPVENFLAAGKILLDEIAARHGKIVQHETDGAGDSLQGKIGIFHDDMNLKTTFPIVQRQRLEISRCVLAATVEGGQANGHCLPKNGQPVLQGNDLMLMQKHQRPIDGRKGFL